MATKKHIYEADFIGLPPLRLVLGEVPSPDPVSRKHNGKQADKESRVMEMPVRRLIAHLKEEKK